MLKKAAGKIVPPKNIIAEPQKKNTAMALLYGSAIVHQKNPEAVISAVPSDHFIKDLRSFKDDIRQAATVAAKQDKIVTIGIRPTYANPGFGYILPSTKSNGHYEVIKFIEKPTAVDAGILIRKDALWNSGIYTFTAARLFTEFSRHQKKYYSLYQKLITVLNQPSKILRLYKLAKNLSIDKAISEKSTSLAMIPAHFFWSDIGEWYSIWNQLTQKSDGTALINNQGTYISHNSKNCLIHGLDKKLIGLVGVNNLAVIDTPDSLLVCNLNDSYDVRDLVTKIVADPKLKNYFLK